MLTHPKSTMHVLQIHMLTYLSMGHVTFLWGEISIPETFSRIRLMAPGGEIIAAV